MPRNKGVGLTSTFRTVILLLMDRPSPCPALTGAVLFQWSTAPLILCELRPLCKTPDEFELVSQQGRVPLAHLGIEPFQVEAVDRVGDQAGQSVVAGDGEVK